MNGLRWVVGARMAGAMALTGAMAVHAEVARAQSTSALPANGGAQSRDPCNVPLLSAEMPANCPTPRNGTLSGGYVGLDIGMLQPARSTADRVGISLGLAEGVRFGLEFWDTLLIGIGAFATQPGDDRPTSEAVVDCTTDVVGISTCDTEPHSVGSGIVGGGFTVETGIQRRFRPSLGVSLSPGAMLGYVAEIGALKRGVDCDGCNAVELDASVSGGYVAPFFRVTFSQLGTYAAVVRSAWFFSGDMQHMTTLGFELFAP
jgi:hypothetical protein